MPDERNTPELTPPPGWEITPEGMSRDGYHALDVQVGLGADGKIHMTGSAKDLGKEQSILLGELMAELKPFGSREGRSGFAPVSAAEFIARRVQLPRWAVTNIWPEGAMGVIGGAPKNGKSSFGLELAVSLATGTPFLGLKDHFPVATAPAPVLYVQVENSEGRVQRDLQEVFAARGLGYFEEEVVDVRAHPVDVNDPESEVVVENVIFREFRPSEDANLGALHVLSNAPLVLEDEEHQAWIQEYVREHGIRYLFCDPLYMMTALDYEQKPASIRPLLTFFTRLKSEDNCAVVLTHHQTSKHTSGSAPSRLLGATYIYGWYESALFTTRNDGIFSLEIDSLRELGFEAEYTLTGRGFGKWELDEHAQDKTDALGRRNTKGAKKEANVTELARLQEEHPEWTRKQLAEALKVDVKTITNYREILGKRALVPETLDA